RPISSYLWRRCLTSANLDEILPKQVSKLMEHAQRLAAPHIGKVMGRWDSQIFRDNEPFSVLYENASYINSDLFLARFADWGLPSQMYAKEIGGAVPKLPFRLIRAIRAFPTFLKMGFASRKGLKAIAPKLAKFDRELDRILASGQRSAERRESDLVNWFVRYYLFIVRSNILINTAISTSLFGGIFSRKTAYDSLKQGELPHRLMYESDPATPREDPNPLSLTPAPQWPFVANMMHQLGVPGLRDLYIELREWFRDNNMRLFHRLHLALKDSAWFDLHPAERKVQGTFWQNGGVALAQNYSFVIYPGTAEGVLGEDILWVEALEPGHFPQYQAAQAVISRTGGQLSHGATLLRELQKPSAVLQSVEEDWVGKKVRFSNGEVTLL
ncbi:MAG: PEP-utilizing enzyme, partial [Bacteroidota bacterium]